MKFLALILMYPDMSAYTIPPIGTCYYSAYSSDGSVRYYSYMIMERKTIDENRMWRVCHLESGRDMWIWPIPQYYENTEIHQTPLKAIEHTMQQDAALLNKALNDYQASHLEYKRLGGK